jgi:hypothetical protein
VYLREAIDIAPIPEPKPRIISLEPISRRSRPKTARKRPDTGVSDVAPHTPTSSGAPLTRLRSDQTSTAEDSQQPRSPSPSDVSFESRLSSSGTASGTEYGIRSINTITDGFIAANGNRAVVKGKTITASIDILKGGFLGGDQIPIKVTVNHNKHVRSLKGIIITLYRQARVDMHPALPVISSGKGDKTKSEEYYPKSRTGLGGLSLSSAGSSHTFRKDLGQSFAPLFVDPRTLTAEIKCSVRVPDEVFPTISNVPGAMISFKYYVEVVVDIQGKLTGLDRMVSNAGVVTVPSNTGSISASARDDAASNTFSTWGGNFVDTDQIRREKGVVSSLFEVVVGTKDSERNGKRKQKQEPLSQNQQNELNYNDSNTPDGYGPDDYYGYDENGQYYDYGYDPAYYDVPGYHDSGTGGEPSYHSHAPPVQTEQEQGLSEKERLRRAEALLLPSQPPTASGPSSPPGAGQYGIPASAPVLEEDDDPNLPYPPAESSSSSAPSHPPPPFRTMTEPRLPSRLHSTPQIHRRLTEPQDGEVRTPTTSSSLTIDATANSPPALPGAAGSSATHAKPLPPLPPQSPTPLAPAPDYSPASSSHVQHTDDKQELQRRRLEMERSAPPDAYNEGSGPSAPPTINLQNTGLAPSAPMLDDEDEDLVGAITPVRSRVDPAQTEGEALPVYER